MTPLLRVLIGGLLTLALLAFGFTVTGHSARARQILTPHGRLAATPGSQDMGREKIWVDGRPALVQACWSRRERPQQVFDRYRAQAAAESLALLVPYALVEDGSGGGQILWTTADGTRLAAMVQGDPRGGTFYRLIEEEPLRTDGPRGLRQLPLGLAAPAGCQLVFSLTRKDGSGTALLAADGDPAAVTARFVRLLSGQGFRVDGRWASGDPTKTMPVEGRGLRGLLSVTPGEGGATSRISLSMERT